LPYKIPQIVSFFKFIQLGIFDFWRNWPALYPEDANTLLPLLDRAFSENHSAPNSTGGLKINPKLTPEFSQDLTVYTQVKTQQSL
jgi:hypothetical protein